MMRRSSERAPSQDVATPLHLPSSPSSSSGSSSSSPDSSFPSSDSDSPLLILRRPKNQQTRNDTPSTNLGALLGNFRHAPPLEVQQGFLDAMDAYNMEVIDNLKKQDRILELEDTLLRTKKLVYNQLDRETKESAIKLHGLFEKFANKRVTCLFAVSKPARKFSLIGTPQKDENNNFMFVADRQANTGCTLHIYDGRSWTIRPSDAKVDDVPLMENLVLISVRLCPPKPLPKETPNRRPREAAAENAGPTAPDTQATRVSPDPDAPAAPPRDFKFYIDPDSDEDGENDVPDLPVL